jgi:hypothetical protein
MVVTLETDLTVLVHAMGKFFFLRDSPTWIQAYADCLVHDAARDATTCLLTSAMDRLIAKLLHADTE